ncbi:MAG: hypothetical protein JWN60_1433 [Acidobacteria bacterium]|jgi:hypothetical protein|nr:hypothetical protein [Acidobacteriota bacterium]
MDEVIRELKELQTKINLQNDGTWAYEESLMFCEIGKLLKVSFFGSPTDESFTEILETLSKKAVAEKVRSLIFDAPDEGANGTNNFDFTFLAESKVVFPNLINFSVKLTEPKNHNRTIMAQTYDEEGVIAKLINKMPKLLALQVPSAPNEEFFDLDSHPLEYLVMQVGYDRQNFIFNLSNSSCFKNLWHFDFTDYQETYVEHWEDYCTPFEDFEQLFNSKAFDSVKVMILRNLTFTDEQITRLKSLRENILFNLIRTESKYIY